MTDEKRDRSRHGPGGRPDRVDEPQDALDLDTRNAPVRDLDDDVMSSAMGGTSDAGTAADDAAESAAFGIGLPDDRTRGTSSGPFRGAERRTGERRGRGRTSGGGSSGHGA